MTIHPNDFAYPCWNGLIQSLDILYGRLSDTHRISAISSFWVLMCPAIGFSALFKQTLTCSHKFKSGDCAGHVVQFILFSCFSVFRARCTGALSSWETYSLSVKYCAITGHKLLSRTSIYIWELIFPLTSVQVPISLKDKHPQIITLTLRWEGRHTKFGQLTSSPFLQIWIRYWSNNYLTFIKIYIFPPVRINSLFASFPTPCHPLFTVDFANSDALYCSS